MTSSQEPSHIQDALAQVRTAYRLLHAYHRRLFDLLELTRDAVVERFGPLPAAWWGPRHFDSIPKRNVDPTLRWVMDFVPLQSAYFQWASSAKPEEGSFSLWISHDADDALQKDHGKDEPDPATFSAASVSRTTLWVCVTAVRQMRSSAQLSDWVAIDARIGKVSGVEEAYWKDSQIHVVDSNEATIAFGGFIIDAPDAATRLGVQERLVAPTLELIEKLRSK